MTSVGYIGAYIHLRDWKCADDTTPSRLLSLLARDSAHATYAQYWLLRDCPWVICVKEGAYAREIHKNLLKNANCRLRVWVEEDLAYLCEYFAAE